MAFHWYNCHIPNSTLHEFNHKPRNKCKGKFRSRLVCNFYGYSAVFVVLEYNWGDTGNKYIMFYGILW